MADEQTNLSAPAPTDAASATPPSEPAAEERDTSWFRRLLRRPDPNSDKPASGDGTEASSQNAASQSVNLSQEDLERRIQAETDRREARRRQQATIEERRKLRDSDPYAYAEQDRAAEQAVMQNQQFTELLGTVGTHHDRASIDPIVMSLDEKERNRILALPNMGAGLDGRKALVEESLKSLRKQWKAEGAAEAEARLRKNPSFRKQVFAEQRGSTVDPELLPSSAAVEGGADVSALLRRSIGRR
jgi:hypothetical protein